MTATEMEKTKKNLVPPDGGWGWVIVCASALNNFVVIPIMQSFGLIFKDTFINMGLSATDGSIIINTNSAFGMLSGLINGPLLRYFGYRKVALAGAFLIMTGVVLTSFATTFTHFMITYGIVTSLGMGMGMSSFSLALNTYFNKNRGKAIGFSMTITGLGPIVMPQLISFLMDLYTAEGALLVVGGIAGHAFIASLLLQPVKWHMKEEQSNEEKEDTENDKDTEKINEDSSATLIERQISRTSENTNVKGSTLSIDYDRDLHSIYGYDTPLTGSILSLTQGPRCRKYSTNSSVIKEQEPTKTKWWSTNSINTVNLGSSMQIFNERRLSKAQGVLDLNLECQNHNNNKGQIYNLEMTVKDTKKVWWKRWFWNVINFFDLTLLNDPTYVNIMLGMSLAVFAELNFSLLTPFILADFELSTAQIASFMSTLAVADIIFRFLAPYIGDYMKQPPRLMYMFTLILLIITRYLLLVFTQYSALMVVAIALGVAKGVRTVYMSLVIPSYVPLERLASASGLQMMVNGLFLMVGGPLLGVIRDVTGSYTNCIYIMNMVTFATVVMWSAEIFYTKCKNSSKSRANQDTLA